MYKIVIFISSLFIIFFSFNLRSEVTVMSWGGKYQSVQKSTLGDSFTQQGGTQINWISWSDNPTLKIQDIIKKDTKNLSVDILDLLIGSRFSLNEIETNSKTALVTLTHDPKIDDPALQYALKNNFFYIGALGSEKTHEKRCFRLIEAGFKKSDVEMINGPIGIKLGGKSPSEIALSIISQLVSEKYKNRT